MLFKHISRYFLLEKDRVKRNKTRVTIRPVGCETKKKMLYNFVGSPSLSKNA